MKTKESTLDEISCRLCSAASNFQFDAVADPLIDLLWLIAEQRPDFEALPELIMQSDKVIRDLASAIDWADMVQQFSAIAEEIVTRYGEKADGIQLGRHGTEASVAATDLNGDAMTDAIVRITRYCIDLSKGVKRLQVVIEENQVRIGRHTTISFNRTLRIPDNGKAYPLPADYGKLPIHPVADYADKVPPHWLEDGGFFIPLYQREALFLEFGGANWRPSIVKVAVGGINATTGESYDEKIRLHKQDYVVIPEQKWLDGINSGEGTVGQFVAMPLGQGYTVEEQLTDEAKVGGFQLVVFEAKQGRFPEEDPEITRQRSDAHEAQIQFQPPPFAKDSIQPDLTSLFPDEDSEIARQKLVAREVQDKWQTEPVAKAPSPDAGALFSGRKRVDDGSRFLSAPTPPKSALSDDGSRFSIGELPDTSVLGESKSVPDEPVEMGIAKGGDLKQQILEDTYGADSWDQQARRIVSIHIVNSAMYERITGNKAPASPITMDEYKNGRVPWFRNYDEHAPTLGPAKLFNMVKSIFNIDKQRRQQIAEQQSDLEVSEELIRHIAIPTREEKIKALAHRIESSWKAGRYKIAHREATCLLDFERTSLFALQFRADCNNKLGRYMDAVGDTSECLEMKPKSAFSLSTRAFAYLRLGEPRMALSDADAALAIDRNGEAGLRIRAEASFAIKHYKDAIADASSLLLIRPRDVDALQLRAKCHLFEGSLSSAEQDATDALRYRENDADSFGLRAVARLRMDNPLGARSDAMNAFKFQPDNPIAKQVMDRLLNL